MVEDNPMDLDFMLQAFEDHGVLNPVHVCRDGEEALQFITSHRDPDDADLPLLTLLDLRLPKVDGIDVLRHARQDPVWRQIPFVVITTSRENRDISRAYELGVNSYIVKPVDLVSPIEYALAVAWNELKYRARVVKEIGATPPVLGSEGRLSQVFLNLLVNAAHAIPEGDVDRHRITVRTWLEGDTVVAEVANTGASIPASHLAHLFEPFFTTKPVGVGTGLGLSIVQGIVTGYGGTITVSSEVGQETRFEIRLPAASRDAWRARTGADDAPAREAVRGRILVVDDDPGLRSLLRRVLRAHEVVTAESGAEACAALARDPRFDLVLCDVMMPRMPGTEVHRWLVANHPELARKVVLMTGGAFTPATREYLDQVGGPIVSKPFVSRELQGQVAEWILAFRQGSG
jgi:CheY-like chemotaxis protein